MKTSLFKFSTNFLIYIFFIFSIISCNPASEDLDDSNIDKNSDLSENNENIEAPVDFEIINISKSEFDDKGTYEFHFELKNNTPHLFSKAYLSAKIKYVFPDGYECEAIFQHGPVADISPLPAEKWAYNESIKYKILSPDNRTSAGCNTTLERTPTKIELELTLRAISIDKEVDDEVVKVIDLLPIWLEKQKQLGLR